MSEEDDDVSDPVTGVTSQFLLLSVRSVPYRNVLLMSTDIPPPEDKTLGVLEFGIRATVFITTKLDRKRGLRPGTRTLWDL